MKKTITTTMTMATTIAIAMIHHYHHHDLLRTATISIKIAKPVHAQSHAKPVHAQSHAKPVQWPFLLDPRIDDPDKGKSKDLQLSHHRHHCVFGNRRLYIARIAFLNFPLGMFKNVLQAG